MTDFPNDNPYESPSAVEPKSGQRQWRPWFVLLIPLLLAGPMWFITKPYVENLPGQEAKSPEDQKNESRLLRIALMASLSIVHWCGSFLYLSYVGWQRAISIVCFLLSCIAMLPALFVLVVFALTTLAPLGL